MQVFPARALAYLSISISLLLVAAYIVDSRVLPKLEDDWRLCGLAWEAENRRIQENLHRKNRASEEDPVWISKGFPVYREKQTSRRILVMGDSFVWGSGCANLNDIWWRQLQRELLRRGYGDVEVIGAGLGGLSTRHELESARWIVPRYKPDAIVWGYVTNDADEKVTAVLRVPPQNLFGALDSAAWRLFPNVLFQIERLRQKKLEQVLERRAHEYPYDEWELKLLEGQNIRKFGKTVWELGQFQKQIGIPIVVIALPTWPSRDYYAARYAPVKPIFEQAGLPFHDILEDFIAKYPDTEAYKKEILRWGVNPANGHPGPRTTHFFACEAAGLLEEDYAGCLGDRTGAGGLRRLRINDWMPYDLNPVERREGMYVLRYPSDDRFMLQMPQRKPYVQLNLEMPASLTRVRVKGEGLQTAELRYLRRSGIGL